MQYSNTGLVPLSLPPFPSPSLLPLPPSFSLLISLQYAVVVAIVVILEVVAGIIAIVLRNSFVSN